MCQLHHGVSDSQSVREPVCDSLDPSWVSLGCTRESTEVKVRRKSQAKRDMEWETKPDGA
jgi:hypothetical protein